MDCRQFPRAIYARQVIKWLAHLNDLHTTIPQQIDTFPYGVIFDQKRCYSLNNIQ